MGPCIETIFKASFTLSGRGNENGRPGRQDRRRLMTDEWSLCSEGLLLAGVKKPGIVVHRLWHSTPTFALLNDANPTRVQKMMRHQHYATTEIYVEKVQKLFEETEEAITQI